MSEPVKTAIFGGVALLTAVVAYVWQPNRVETPIFEVGTIFPEFDDPQKATSLEIVRYDQDLGEISEFEVARNKLGRWVIPSHENYPADAEEQMRDAALALINLEALGVQSENAETHKELGVLEPKPDETRAGDTGVGTLARVRDKNAKVMAALVIGKADPDMEGQYFVRKPGQDRTYIAKVDPTKLSTKFEDWIEKDLLKLDSLEVETINLRDYSVLQVLQGTRIATALSYKNDMTLKWDKGKSDWLLEELLDYGQGSEPTQGELADYEELDDTKLNQMKTSLGDLKIVDVRSKPEGLGADLKAGDDFMNNEATLQDLLKRGFFPSRSSSDQTKLDLLAANGEVRISMTDGVIYLLRFGSVTGTQQDEEETKLNRYLFVMAELDESKIPPPELQEVPPLEENPKVDAAETDSKDDENETADGDDVKSEAEIERERIERENKLKQEEYDQKLADARTKVQELNERFGPWYYIISEDEYKKIHLSRVDVIVENQQAKEEGFGVDAFRKLEDEGLEND